MADDSKACQAIEAAQPKDNSALPRMDVDSERGALIQRVEVVRLECAHCTQKIQIGPSEQLRQYDQGQRINIACPMCKGLLQVGRSQIIRAGSVPTPVASIAGGLIRRR